MTCYREQCAPFSLSFSSSYAPKRCASADIVFRIYRRLQVFNFDHSFWSHDTVRKQITARHIWKKGGIFGVAKNCHIDSTPITPIQQRKQDGRAVCCGSDQYAMVFIPFLSLTFLLPTTSFHHRMTRISSGKTKCLRHWEILSSTTPSAVTTLASSRTGRLAPGRPTP